MTEQQQREARERVQRVLDTRPLGNSREDINAADAAFDADSFGDMILALDALDRVRALVADWRKLAAAQRSLAAIVRKNGSRQGEAIFVSRAEETELLIARVTDALDGPAPSSTEDGK